MTVPPICTKRCCAGAVLGGYWNEKSTITNGKNILILVFDKQIITKRVTTQSEPSLNYLDGLQVPTFQ